MPVQISVVIPSSGRNTLRRTLASLEKQTLHSDRFEVLVVFDGGPDQQLVKLDMDVTPYRLSTFSQPRSGAAKARNYGARQSQGDLLIFLDDDVRAEPDLLERHFNFHQNADSLAVAFGRVPIDPASPNTFLRRWIEGSQEKYFKKCETGMDASPFYFCSANFSIRKDSFFKVDGFDESFHGYGWEEADLGVRLKRAGFRFVYLKDAIAGEMYIKDTQQAAGLYAFEAGKNETRFVGKYPEYRSKSNLKKMVLGSPLARLLIRCAWHAPGLLRALGFLVPVPGWRHRLRYLASYWSGVKAAGASLQFLNKLFRMNITVLVYHDIAEQPHGLFDVSRNAFEKQMRLLKRKGYQAVTAGDYIEWIDSGIPLPENPVLITFDDGYESFYRLAAPILTHHGFTAEIFLCPSLVGKENTWDQERGGQRKLLMNWDQIRELHTRFHFSAHSLSHLDLTSGSGEQVYHEIFGAKSQMAEKLESPSAFAYPYGRATPELARVVASAGYTCAFTTEEGLNSIETDRFLLRRAVVDKWDFLPLFRFKLRSGFTFLKTVRELLRKVRRHFRAVPDAGITFRPEDRF